MHRVQRHTRARSRAALVAAVALALPLAWPGGTLGAGSTARLPGAASEAGRTAPADLAVAGEPGADPGPTVPGDVASTESGGDFGPFDGDPAAGTSDGQAEPGGPATPSEQYLDSLAHAADHIDFQPGGRVTVGFRPRAGDTWSVDGGRARALPPGSLSGAQMRDASDASAGAGPSEGAGPPGAAIGAIDVGATGMTPLADLAAAVSPTGLHRAVLGFLPYWEVSDSDTTLDYSTLSTIAYFSVGCASGGTLLKKNADGSTTTGWGGWTSSRMTSIINAAHTAGTRVVLTLTCFAWSSSGAKLQASILNSSTYRASLAAQVAKAVHDRGADGVNLDFEPLVSGTEAGFTAFVRTLRSKLSAYAAGYELTFDTMGYPGNYPIENATAPGGADALMVMGYDYRDGGSTYAGSISPLTGPPYDLTDTIAAYRKRISPSKILLGVPYYGRAWSTSSSALHARNISGTKYGASTSVTYASAVGVVAAHGRKWDDIEQAPWSVYQKQTCTTTYGCVTSWRQLYYDDAASLGRRYDLINRSGMRGAGIWALGFDGTRPELSEMLADKFRRDTTPPVVGISNLGPTQVDEAFPVAWKAYDDTGVASYDVEVSRDGGSWATWLTATTATSNVFPGTNGHTYAFRVRARDTLGNTSGWLDASLAGLSTPSSIAVGRFATVAYDGLHLRASADTSASAMATLARGTVLLVTGGPTTADGYTWYRVNGPIGQWGPVDLPQRGGWVAVTDGTTRYVVPRMPPYATRVVAGITDFAVGGGGDRVVTPNGDGVNDAIRIAWTNTAALDGLTLRVFSADGSLVGSRSEGSKLAAGAQATSWNGSVGGVTVPNGNYVLQLVGTRGSASYAAPSAAPVTSTQLLRYGIAVGPIPPTSVSTFKATTASPTRSTTISYSLVFGASVHGLTASDLVRGGTATGCVISAVTGSGASYAITVSKCSAGTVSLSLRANAVIDGVGNVGPDAAVAARTVRIDRTAPSMGSVTTGIPAGLTLTSPNVTARVIWSATDTGGAGIAGYDVERSVDGAAFSVIKTGVTTAWLAVSLAPGHTYRFAVRARDRAGNVSGWKAGATTSMVIRQDSSTTLSYGSGWRTSTATGFSGGTARYATAAGARVSYTFTGRAIAFVTTLSNSRGQVKVYLDGSYVTTLDLGRATTSYRWVAWQKRFSTASTHTLRLVVVGTAGRPRVDVDALVVLR